MEIGNFEIKRNSSSAFCSVGTNLFFKVDVFYIVVPTQRPRVLLTENIQSGATITI